MTFNEIKQHRNFENIFFILFYGLMFTIVPILVLIRFSQPDQLTSKTNRTRKNTDVV